MSIFQKTCLVAAVLPLLCAMVRAAAPATQPWRADPELVARLSAKRPQIIYDEAKVPKYDLPDPLKSADGQTVASSAKWPARRAELMELFRDQMYGRMPPRPAELRFEILEDKPDALSGAATLRRVAIRSKQGDRTHQFELILFVPNAGKRPAPVFVLINNRPPENSDSTREKRSPFWPVEEMVARGYGMAVFACGQVAPDDAATFRDGALKLFEDHAATSRPTDACGALAAWAWGASRVMDYLQTDPRVDAKKVAIVGHSRGGKASLWAAAEDERFGLAVSNASGEGGASLSRRRFGETVAIINKSFPHWFCDNFKPYADRENDLPFDQHVLVAMIAPRPVYIASGSEDLWADPRGEFLSLAAASGVYGLWGRPPIGEGDMPPVETPLVVPPRGYHVHAGPHNLGLYDWNRFADFADLTWGDADPGR